LDHLLPHKSALEKHLSDRLGELFGIEYDLLLYDVTSTYFEGEAAANDEAARGYSRDHRPDCKQVCIGLVVSRSGLPLGYEIFAGNTADVTTVKKIVTTIEKRYGVRNRIWVMDRGMVSEDNMEFLASGNRRYILGTPKSQLRQFEKQLVEDGWSEIRDGLEVKLCSSPAGGEIFILCRSAQRREKEKAMHDRFAKRIEAALTKLADSCRKQKRDPLVVSRQVGRLLGQNTRSRAVPCRCSHSP
jgi:transposase